MLCTHLLWRCKASFSKALIVAGGGNSTRGLFVFQSHQLLIRFSVRVCLFYRVVGRSFWKIHHRLGAWNRKSDRCSGQTGLSFCFVLLRSSGTWFQRIILQFVHKNKTMILRVQSPSHPPICLFIISAQMLTQTLHLRDHISLLYFISTRLSPNYSVSQSRINRLCFCYWHWKTSLHENNEKYNGG